MQLAHHIYHSPVKQQKRRLLRSLIVSQRNHITVSIYDRLWTPLCAHDRILGYYNMYTHVKLYTHYGRKVTYVTGFRLLQSVNGNPAE